MEAVAATDMSTFFDSNGIIVGFGIFLVAMLVFFLFCGFLRKWLQGPTKGSENLRRLDGKVNRKQLTENIFLLKLV